MAARASTKIPVRHRLRRAAPRKPAGTTIALAEHALKARRSGSRRASAAAMPQAQTDAAVESDRRIADGARAHRRRHSPSANDALAGDRNAARMRGGRGRGRGRAQARAGLDRARAVRRNRGAGERLLPPAGRRAAHRRARQRRALCHRARKSSRTSSAPRSFEGRLVVLAEPDIALGDCRIEWADGGVKRDSAAAEAAISEAVDGYIGARRNFADDARDAEETRA